MHQSHNIPWNILTSNFEFKENDTRFRPPYSGLESKNKPNASQELKHFIRKFVQAIRTFSDTERAKHPEPKSINPLLQGNVFSDELKQKYPEYLDDRNQNVEYWIKCAGGGKYGTQHGELADVIKILLYENEMSTLLMLAHHPKIPITSLHHLSWGNWNDFGFSRIKWAALNSYLFFNSAEATNILSSGQYTHSDQYTSLILELGQRMDYPAQQVPHRIFFKSCGPGMYNERGFLEVPVTDGKYDARGIYVHTNFGDLHEYLKTLFALLYRYDVLMRECGMGVELEWDLEIAAIYPINKLIKVNYLNPSNESGRWTYELV